MKMKQRTSIIALSISLMVLLAGCTGGSKATVDNQNALDGSDTKVYTLVYSSWQSPESSFYKEIEAALAANLEEMSEGRIKVQIYSGGSLAAQPEALNAVRNGTADIACGAPGIYGGQFPMSMLLDSPGLGFTSAKMMGEIYKEYIELYAADEYKDLVVVPFSTGPMGISLKTKVTNISETKNIQVRAGASLINAVNATGFTGVNLPTGELYEALRTGLVQGAISSAEAVGVFKLNEVAKYYLDIPFFNACQFIFMNKTKYESLPEDLRAVVDQALEKTYQDCLIYNDVKRLEALDGMKAAGMEVITVADEAAWYRALRPFAAEEAQKLDAQGLKGTEALAWLTKRISEYK